MRINRPPNEPEASSPAAVQVLFRLPSGQSEKESGNPYDHQYKEPVLVDGKF